jgi:hypothetical protein
MTEHDETGERYELSLSMKMMVMMVRSLRLPDISSQEKVTFNSSFLCNWLAVSS